MLESLCGDGGWCRGFFTFRIVPNAAQHAGPTCSPISTVPDCRLAIVEFDDEGLCFDRTRLGDLEPQLAALDGTNPIIIAFVHGWKHNAAATDDNLVAFRDLLAQTASNEQHDAQQHGRTARPVLGVFVSWRGLSWDGNIVWAELSFWDRLQAAQRLAQGSPRELLGRLKAFRNRQPLGDDGRPRATLLIIGHSFGGLIVFTALAQSLIEAASTQEKLVPSFGNLVLLLNPAFSAISYLPIHQIVAERKFQDQLPVFVSATAENDGATGTLYPVGNLTRLITENWRGLAMEREALIRTMGHVPWLRTHTLSLVPKPEPAVIPQAPARMLALSQPAAPPQDFGDVRVTPSPGAQASPFWVASATPQVIDGHNGITLPPLRSFVRSLLGAHLGHETVLADAPPAAS
jgi:hypothetical protein